MSFSDILIIASSDKNHGVILIPEGLVESIPELYALLQVNWFHYMQLHLHSFVKFFFTNWMQKFCCFSIMYCFNSYLAFIGAVTYLFQEIHGLHVQGISVEKISSHLSPWASALFDFLPPFIRKQVPLNLPCDDCKHTKFLAFNKVLRFGPQWLLVTEAFMIQLLLHPESDDSAQLSQVLHCHNKFMVSVYFHPFPF